MRPTAAASRAARAPTRHASSGGRSLRGYRPWWQGTPPPCEAGSRRVRRWHPSADEPARRCVRGSSPVARRVGFGARVKGSISVEMVGNTCASAAPSACGLLKLESAASNAVMIAASSAARSPRSRPPPGSRARRARKAARRHSAACAKLLFQALGESGEILQEGFVHDRLELQRRPGDGQGRLDIAARKTFLDRLAGRRLQPLESGGRRKRASTPLPLTDLTSQAISAPVLSADGRAKPVMLCSNAISIAPPGAASTVPRSSASPPPAPPPSAGFFGLLLLDLAPARPHCRCALRSVAAKTCPPVPSATK